MKSCPSIFNDVIGPVMRGPSSSHCAAALRIGRVCRDLMKNDIIEVYIEFDPNGSLATTHSGQGSDMGLFGGLLGWEADDERLKDYEFHIKEAGIKVTIDIHPIGATHPNTYKITLKNKDESHQLIGLSTGGGMIEIIEIDGAPVSMTGGFYTTLLYSNHVNEIVGKIRSLNMGETVLPSDTSPFILVNSNATNQQKLLETLTPDKDIQDIIKITPVLPIKSRIDQSVPFITVEEMLKYNEGKDLNLWQLALVYESERGNIPKA